MNEPVIFRDVRFPIDDAQPRPEPREPAFGAVSPSSPRPSRVTRPRSQIIASFETQQVRLRANGRLLAFERSDSPGLFPFAHPVIVASTSIHSYDEPAVQSVPAVEAVAISSDRQWLDRMWIMRDSALALAVAAGLGGRFAMRWTESGVNILDLASGEHVLDFAVSGLQLTQRSCPLIPDSRPGDLCKPHGGPWVSRSMTAARNWNDRRRLYWDLVGCDQGCAPPMDRQSISVPTRYDMWMGSGDLAQPEQHNDGHCRVYLRADGKHRLGPGRAHPTPGVLAVTTPDGLSRCMTIEEPIVLSRGMIVEVGVEPAHLWSALGRMLVDPAGGAEDPLDWCDAPLHWQTTDADLRVRCDGLQILERWAAIGPLRVTGARVAEQVVPLAFDLRSQGSGLLLEKTWMQVSTYRLGQVGTWCFWVHDGLGHARIEPTGAPLSPVDVAVEKILQENLQELVALGLEPYDPTWYEAQFDRRRHLAHRDAAVGEMDFGIATDQLRHRLRGSPEYERVRAALQRPSSDPEFFEQLRAYVNRSAKGETFRLH